MAPGEGSSEDQCEGHSEELRGLVIGGGGFKTERG